MNHPQKKADTPYLILSIMIHLVVLGALTIKVLFFPDTAPEYKSAIRVDVVALPEKIKNPPQPAAPKKEKTKKPVAKKEPPKPKPKPKKVVKKKPKLKAIKKKITKAKTKKIKDEQDSAIARLRALKNLRDKEQKAATQKIEYKGNQISKGNSLTGLAKLHHESYLDQLDSHIRGFWNLPEWLASGNLKARVLLRISRTGSIVAKTFLTGSGNELFDEHVMSTLEKASPLPIPPKDLLDFYATKGVEIRFPE